jgi:hypothetical protein
VVVKSQVGVLQQSVPKCRPNHPRIRLLGMVGGFSCSNWGEGAGRMGGRKEENRTITKATRGMDFVA